MKSPLNAGSPEWVGQANVGGGRNAGPLRNEMKGVG